MKDVIGELVRRKIPVNSYIAAYNEFSNSGITSQYLLDDFLIEVVGGTVETKTLDQLIVIAGYAVQESVRQHMQGIVPIAADILLLAQEKCRQFYLANPHLDPEAKQIVLPEGEEFVPDRKHRAPRGSGQSKKERCIAVYNKYKDKTRKELIPIFVAELGLTPAGASTYVHNCQKGIWK